MTVDLSRAFSRRGLRPRTGLVRLPHVGPCAPTGGGGRGGMRGCGRFGGALTGSRLFFGNAARAEWDFTHASCQFNYQDGAGEQLTNGDFEIGSPPSNWSPGSGATLTAEAGARTGGGGSQVLRATIAIADNLGYATQSAATVGARYRVQGWARGDGANGQPRVYNQSTVLWTGTTSNTWQYFDVDFTAGFTIMRLWVTGNVATVDYAEFDDCTMVELPGYALAPNRIIPGTRDLSKAIAANMPWRNPTGYNGGLAAQWDRTALLDMIAHAVGSDVFGRLPQDSPFTVAMIGQITNLTSGDWILGAGRAASGTPQHGLLNLTGNYRTSKKEDSGVSSSNTDGAIDTNRHTLIWTNTGIAESLYVDKVVTAISGSGSDRGPTTLDQFALGAKVNASVISARISAMFVEVWIANTAFNSTVVANAHDYLVAKHGGI